MKVQTISNQTTFNGKAHFTKEFNLLSKDKVAKVLEKLSFNQKPYDLFISNSAIMAKRLQDINNPIAPRVTTIINPKKIAITDLIESTMKNFEYILDNLKA